MHLICYPAPPTLQLVLEAFGDQRAVDVWGFRPGDQWVWTMMCMNNPEKCRTLPKIWNVSGCSKPRFLGLNARDRDQVGLGGGWEGERVGGSG